MPDHRVNISLFNLLFTRGAQIFQKCRNHLEILCAILVACSELHSEEPQALVAIVHNSVAIRFCVRCGRSPLHELQRVLSVIYASTVKYCDVCGVHNALVMSVWYIGGVYTSECC